MVPILQSALAIDVILFRSITSAAALLKSPQLVGLTWNIVSVIIIITITGMIIIIILLVNRCLVQDLIFV